MDKVDAMLALQTGRIQCQKCSLNVTLGNADVLRLV